MELCEVNTLPLVTLECTCDEAIERTARTLVDAGLRVLVSFDSRHLRSETDNAPCPHHGDRECDCQVTILLVYGSAKEPATVLARGQDGSTALSLAIAPTVRPPARFENKLRALFASMPVATA
jgi:hypothetical protein